MCCLFCFEFNEISIERVLRKNVHTGNIYIYSYTYNDNINIYIYVGVACFALVARFCFEFNEISMGCCGVLRVYPWGAESV